MAINKATVAAVTPLAQALGNRGFALTPHPQGLLASLNSASSFALPSFKANGVSLEGLPVDEAAGEGHDSMQAGLISAGIEVMQYNWDVSRNVALPAIRDIIAKIEERVGGLFNDPLRGVLVTAATTYQAWDNPSLYSLVEAHSEHQIDTTLQRLGLADGGDDLSWYRKMASTGATGLDSDAGQVLDALGETLPNLYRGIFTSGDNALYEDILTVRAVPDPRLLAVHLWARQLLNDVQSSSESLNLAGYRIAVTNIRIQTARALARSLETRMERTKNGDVIIQAPTLQDFYAGNGSVIVDSYNYDKFLQGGGSPEIVLGAALTTRVKTASALLENADEYVKAWTKFESNAKEANRINRIQLTRQAAQYFTVEGIKALDPKHYNTKSLGEVVSAACTMLDELHGGAFADLYTAIRQVLCGAVFGETMVMEFLQAIDAIGEANDSLEADACAAIALTNLAAQWMAKHTLTNTK